MKKNKILLAFVLALPVLMFSCNEDTLEPTLAQNKDVETSIQTAGDLQGILEGMYNRMTQTAYYGRDMILYGEVRSDNCYANTHSGRILTPAAMAMGTTDAHPTDTWTAIYRVIASANIIISKENAGITGDAAEINSIVGQAYAMRALAHFDLLRLFGEQHVTGATTVGIPYIREYKGANLFPARNTVAECKQFIYDDLTAAATLMDAAYDDGAKQHATTYTVDAIRARVAIYFGDFAIAKTACEAIITPGDFDIIPAGSFVSSWSSKSPVNSIFELAFSSVDNMGINGIQYIYRGSSYGDVRALDNLQAIFGAGDVRNAAGMIGMDNGYLSNIGKYPTMAGYSDDIFLFRYEEVILNYAEALMELGTTGIAGKTALAYLNDIPAARGAAAYGAITQDNILLERRKELCFEGFRFDDLARTGKNIPFTSLPAGDQTKVTHGEVVYGSYNYAFPIPRVETTANANCIQNLGYL
jgi:hypothetical protein